MGVLGVLGVRGVGNAIQKDGKRLTKPEDQADFLIQARLRDTWGLRVLLCRPFRRSGRRHPDPPNARGHSG
ncbi:hypothetical protein GCM10010278_82210 [Streptomyces melanogenes]|nr:hypothetical protein GCM10010278_82210 [Streptomyces melanogenes]